MNKNHCPKYSGSELSIQIVQHIEELAQATDATRMSEEMIRYLDTCARFHHYSLFNIWLILMQCPQATMVAGYHKWQSMNRYVRKGEHGIPILAPILVKEKAEDDQENRVLHGFKVVYVFDVSQTEGDPLPEPPDWKSPERNAELQEKLIAFARSQGISVSERQLAGDIQGVSRGGAIELSPQSGTITLIHEITHELLHHHPDAPLDKSIRELEAEAVAYVVGKHFGLEGIGSPNYIALHGNDPKSILTHMERLQSTVELIIMSICQC